MSKQEGGADKPPLYQSSTGQEPNLRLSRQRRLPSESFDAWLDRISPNWIATFGDPDIQRYDDLTTPAHFERFLKIVCPSFPDTYVKSRADYFARIHALGNEFEVLGEQVYNELERFRSTHPDINLPRLPRPRPRQDRS